MDMDFRQPPRSQPPQPPQPAYHEPAAPEDHYDARQNQHLGHHKSGKGKAVLKFLVVIVLIAAAAGGAWYYRDKQAKDQAKSQQAQISDLQTQLNTARDQLAAANTNAQPTQTTNQTGPSDETVKKVQDSLSSGKYPDIKSQLSSKTVVIIAASEGLGSRTPDQVVTDLKYLDKAKDPWNFKLPTETLAAYQDGDYAQYFPTGAVVGKSADGYVVSVVFNDAGKITAIFLSNSDKIL